MPLLAVPIMTEGDEVALDIFTLKIGTGQIVKD